MNPQQRHGRRYRRRLRCGGPHGDDKHGKKTLRGHIPTFPSSFNIPLVSALLVAHNSEPSWRHVGDLCPPERTTAPCSLSCLSRNPKTCEIVRVGLRSLVVAGSGIAGTPTCGEYRCRWVGCSSSSFRSKRRAQEH